MAGFHFTCRCTDGFPGPRVGTSAGAPVSASCLDGNHQHDPGFRAVVSSGMDSNDWLEQITKEI